MSLITCKECGKEYSDKTESCSVCACPTKYNLELEKDLNNPEGTINCDECGGFYEISLSACPNCGCPTTHNVYSKISPIASTIQSEVSMALDGEKRFDRDRIMSRFSNNEAEINQNGMEEKVESFEHIREKQSLKYLLNPLEFNGRVGRLHYTIISIISTFIAGSIYYVLRDSIINGLYDIPTYLTAILALIGLIFILLDASITVRRLHDINRSGSLLILMVLPIISTVFWIALMIIKGQVGTNKYGDM